MTAEAGRAGGTQEKETILWFTEQSRNRSADDGHRHVVYGAVSEQRAAVADGHAERERSRRQGSEGRSPSERR